MLLIRLFGSASLVLAGFLLHLLLSADYVRQQEIILIGFILASIYLGLTAVLSTNKETFTENSLGILYFWP